MKAAHFVDPYLINPTNPITVNLIGAGGTGSQVLTGLAKMSYAMNQLHHPGLFVTVWDDDIVTPANLGRQLFAESEVGLAKACALVNRTNRFFGTSWRSRHERFSENHFAESEYDTSANITITCVDTVESRKQTAAVLKRKQEQKHGPGRRLYWLDFGNSKDTGQVILATVGKIKQPESKEYAAVASLPFVTDEYGDLLKQSEQEDNTPSCSLAEALQRQELFINPALAQMGCSLLWSLFREGVVFNRGLFMNLKDFRSQPVKISTGQ